MGRVTLFRARRPTVKDPMMTAARSGTGRRCLCFSTHIVSQTYDKPNNLILKCEKFLLATELLEPSV